MEPAETRAPAAPAPGEAACDGGKAKLRAEAAEAGQGELLDRYARDYPVGPHDQPQSMCPAFGSLRVGLRMRRTATVLSGSACCVYGLTFTSHFYGARRTVGYVPFDSESLVTGKLFEDLRDAVHALARPEEYDTVVVINLCVRFTNRLRVASRSMSQRSVIIDSECTRSSLCHWCRHSLVFMQRR